MEQREASLALCEDLEAGERGCMYNMADLHSCVAETSTTLKSF